VSINEDWNVCECGSPIELDSSAMNSDAGDCIPVVDSLGIRALWQADCVWLVNIMNA
jgi:hypothetical protein